MSDANETVQSPAAYADGVDPGTERFWVAVLLVAAVFLFGIGMARTGFQGEDELRYSQAAKSIQSVPGMFVMHMRDRLYPDKPPLTFLAVRASFGALGGVSPFAARVPLFLSSVGALVFCYLLIRQLQGPKLALVATPMIGLAMRFVWTGKWLRLDMPMLVFVFAAFWVSTRLLFPRPGQKPVGFGWALLGWLFITLAGLAKGPGVLVWIGVILTYAAVSRRWAPLRIHRPLAGLALLVGAFAAWLIPAYHYGGTEYLGPMIGTHVVERFAGTVQHAKNPLYFLYRTPVDFLPAGLLLPVALWHGWTIRKSVSDAGQTRFIYCWFLFCLVFFSIPTGKRSQYILPVYPAAAMIVARFVLDAVGAARGSLPQRLLYWHSVTIAALCAAGGAALVVLPMVRPDAFEVPPPVYFPVLVAVVLVACAVVAVHALRSDRFLRGYVALCLAFLLPYAALFGIYNPLRYDDTPVREALAEMTRISGGTPEMGMFGGDDRFALYGDAQPRYLFRKREKGTSIGTETPEQVHAAVDEFMAGGVGRWLLARPERVDAFREERGGFPWRAHREVDVPAGTRTLVFRSE